MTINWKSAARAFRIRSEADRRMLDTARESLAMLRDERSDAEFDSWEDAARHWWERMRQAEQERDELLQKLEELRASLARETAVRLAHESASVMRAVYGQQFPERKEMEPSNIPGEFADLAARIAEADAKHPRDLDWWEPRGMSDFLDYSRKRLADTPTWENALRCEVDEAVYEVFCGNMERLADELLDVATVAMRWRRAALERGKR